MARRGHSFYFYRGYMIERFGRGWTWTEEMTWGLTHGPIYRTIEDAKNAIRMYLDGTHTAEPRIIGEWIWDSAERNSQPWRRCTPTTVSTSTRYAAAW